MEAIYQEQHRWLDDDDDDDDDDHDDNADDHDDDHDDHDDDHDDNDDDHDEDDDHDGDHDHDDHVGHNDCMCYYCSLLRKFVEVLPGKCWKIGKKKDLIIGHKLKGLQGRLRTEVSF